MMWDGHHPGVWLLFGTIWMLIFWGVSHISGGRPRDENEALEIARLRYARGEITKQQFEQLRRDLSG